jgi:membrane-associated protein
MYDFFILDSNPSFILYNMIGGIPWIALFIIGGYFLGNIPIVANNFELVILFVIIISISPGIISTLLKNRTKK